VAGDFGLKGVGVVVSAVWAKVKREVATKPASEALVARNLRRVVGMGVLHEGLGVIYLKNLFFAE